jgi:hypothetical protein
VNVEPADAVHALQLLEAVERHFRRSRDELEQLGTLLLVERAHSTPEPLDLLRGRSVVVILRVALPVVDINIGQTRYQQLQLLFIKYGNEIRWNDIVEAYVNC